MSTWSSKWVGFWTLLLLNGVLIEVDNAYKTSMGVSNIVLPAVKVMEFPQAFHHMPISETPFVQEVDRMLLTSSTVAFYDYSD